MSRQEFLEALEKLLQDINEQDKAEALQYYNDYFEDAGVENEQNVINDLGSPEKVAAIIKEDLRNENMQDKGEFTEKGYQNPAYADQGNKVANFERRPEVNQDQNSNQNNGQNQSYSSQQNNGYGQNYYQGNQNNAYGQQNQAKKEPEYVYEYTKVSGWAVLAIIVLFPIWFPLLMSIFGVGFGIICAIFGITIAFGATGIALLVGGVTLLGIGIAKLFVFPLLGVCCCGAALILIGLAMFFAVGTKFIIKIIPVMFKGFINICKLPFRRKVMA